jgi:hypothetical protein
MADYTCPLPAIEEAAQQMESREVAREADAGFDAGEFSGPAHDRAERADIEKIAARYNVDADTLQSEAWQWLAERDGSFVLDGSRDPEVFS